MAAMYLLKYWDVFLYNKPGIHILYFFNKSTGVGGETRDLETESQLVSGAIAGVVTVGTSGVLMKLGNWETTTLEACLSVITRANG